MLLKAGLLLGALLLVAFSSAFAFDPIDLTTGQTGVTSTVDGSIWSSNITQPTGTGVYQPFLRIQANPSEQGFNTDFKPFPLDDKNPSNFTHSVQWGALATVTISGTDYYSFQLDANEQQNGTRGLISLDALKIYNSANPNDARTGTVTVDGQVFTVTEAGVGIVITADSIANADSWARGAVAPAMIVHSADVEADIDRSPQAAGLKAIAMGFRRIYDDRDHEKLEAQMSVYDALYAWCAETS